MHQSIKFQHIHALHGSVIAIHPFGSREGIPDTERFRDKELLYKALYKFAYFTFTLLFVRVE